MPKLICASGASSELGGNAWLFSVLITCQDWDSSGNFELNKFFLDLQIKVKQRNDAHRK